MILTAILLFVSALILALQSFLSSSNEWQVRFLNIGVFAIKSHNVFWNDQTNLRYLCCAQSNFKINRVIICYCNEILFKLPEILRIPPLLDLILAASSQMLHVSYKGSKDPLVNRELDSSSSSRFWIEPPTYSDNSLSFTTVIFKKERVLCARFVKAFVENPGKCEVVIVVQLLITILYIIILC